MTGESNGLRLAYLRTVVTGRRCLADAGLDDTGAALAYFLLSRRRTWQIAALSDQTGLSRVTVRRWLSRAERRRWVIRYPRGFRMTETGRAWVADAADDALRRCRWALAKLRSELTES